MRKIVMFVLFFFITTPIFSAEPDEKLHKKCLYPTVRIKSILDSNSGSGFIVKSTKKVDKYENVLITCAHVVEEADFYSINQPIYENWSEFDCWQDYKGIVYYKNNTADLAVVLFESEEEMPCVELNFTEKLFIGNELFKIGCGLGDEPRLDFGKITSTNYKLFNYNDLLRHNAHTIYGDSGGPVFHNYKVIGYTQAIRVMRGFPVFNIGFAIPISRLKTIDNNENNALSFVYKSRMKNPVIAFAKLKFSDYEVIEK